jgi:hypothetical protein
MFESIADYSRRSLMPAALVFFFSLCMLSGCGATASSATQQPRPQPTTVARPFHATVQTFDGAFTVTLDITPDHSGVNLFTAQVRDNHANRPATHVQIVLYTTMQDMAMGTDSIALHDDGKGQFSASGSNLSMGGHWAIGITIATTDHIIHKAGVSFVVPW